MMSIVIIVSYHIVDLKRQNRLKVGTDKPKLKVKMQSVSEDDVRKRLLEKLHSFQLSNDLAAHKSLKAYTLHKVTD